MAFCSNCGNELREGANFCPKCGSPIIQAKKAGNVKKMGRYGVIAIAILATFYIIGKLGGNNSEDKASKPQTEQALKADKALEEERRKEKQKEEETKRMEERAKQKEAEALRKEEELKSKIMDYTAQISNIMTKINDLYNSYVQVGSSGAMNEFSGVHAIGDISDLKMKGDAIFDKMINLARQYNNRDIQNAIKQEKMDFDDKANQMTRSIREFIYNQ